MIGSIEQVLSALEDANVRYLVVGGLAAVLHGRLRTTADLDLVISLDTDNALSGIRALSGLAYRPRAPVQAEAFADPAQREAWIRDKGLTVFSMWSPKHPTLEVDLFVREPFGFDEVFQRSVVYQLDHTVARVVALKDLIAMKLAAGRPQDLADVDALRALLEEGGNE